MNTKKSLSALLALVLLVGAFTLSACGGGRLSGTYEVESAEMAGITMSKEEMAAAGMNMKLDFSGSKVTVTVNEKSGSGSYEVDGNKITIMSSTSDETIDGTLSKKDKVIEIEAGPTGVNLILKKVS